jgi:hypothetical protein
MVSKFGVIPKKYQPGKWRLILDLSSPQGHSVNDGIDQAMSAIAYPSVDVAAQLILQMGQGALLSKVDIKEAYRIVPVHRQDWHLLGMKWNKQYYVDTHLPFGLRSAPKIFSAIADALQWILTQHGSPTSIHYLDDYLFIEPPGSQGKALATVTPLLQALGVPTAPNKMEGPSTRLTFLGIELDSVNLTAQLPADKLARLVLTLHEWGDRKRCTKRELLSLIGILQHAATVVRFGRAFVRALIDLAKSADALHHHIHLFRDCRADLLWWESFAPQWNGQCFLAPAILMQPSSTVTSDASGTWGCGGIYQEQWFQFTWSKDWHPVHITAKELVPIVLAAILWGNKWQGQAVLFQCDNQAVVHCIKAHTSKDPLVMQLLRCLFMLAATHNFYPLATHIAGIDNGPADALSRDMLSTFHHQVPLANPQATAIPHKVTALFQQPAMDWISPSWRRVFMDSWRRV